MSRKRFTTMVAVVLLLGTPLAVVILASGETVAAPTSASPIMVPASSP